MAEIAVRQAQETNLRRQLASRRYYFEAKRIQGAGTYFVAALALTSPFVLLFVPGLGPPLAAAAGLWIFLSRFVFQRFKRELVLEGVIAQEAFDHKVLGLDWNDALARRPAPEDIRIASQRFIKKIVKVENWYPAVVSAEWPTSVLICQRANAVWARRQHRSYGRLLGGGVVLWVVVGIVIAACDSASLVEYLTIIALPSLPALLDTAELSNSHSEAASDRGVIEQQTGDLLRRGGTSNYELREVQDQLFDLRRDGPLVPEWFYGHRRESYEEAMRHAATDLVHEAHDPEVN